MTLFDATKGKKVVSDEVETLSHEFAALFDDLPPRKQREVLDKMNAILVNSDSIDALTAGTYAQDSSGAPAKALGSAATSGTPSDSGEALKVILADTTVDEGFKHLLRRGYDQSAPDHIVVERDGTPKELLATRKERDAAKTAQKAAEDKLAEQLDDTKSGSLAEQLKKAKASPPAPAADVVKKSDMKASLEDIKTDVEALKGKVGGNVTGKKELLEKLDKGIAKL